MMGDLWINPVYKTLHESSTAAGDGEILNLEGKYACAVVQISGSTGVITFKGSVDGDNWSNLACANLVDGAATLTATAPGIFSIPVLGLNKFKGEITTHAGTVKAVAHVLPVTNSVEVVI